MRLTKAGYARVAVVGVIIWLGLSIDAKAADGWDKVDYSLAGALGVAHVADFAQTIQIRKRDDLREVDPVGKRIMGEQPETGTALLYFAGVYAAELGVAHVLPSDWRKVWLGGRLAFSVYTVHNNYRLGLKVRF